MSFLTQSRRRKSFLKKSGKSDTLKPDISLLIPNPDKPELELATKTRRHEEMPECFVV